MTMITPSYLGETIEYSSLHACRSTLEDPTCDVAYFANRYRLEGGVDATSTMGVVPTGDPIPPSVFEVMLVVNQFFHLLQRCCESTRVVRRLLAHDNRWVTLLLRCVGLKGSIGGVGSDAVPAAVATFAATQLAKSPLSRALATDILRAVLPHTIASADVQRQILEEMLDVIGQSSLPPSLPASVPRPSFVRPRSELVYLFRSLVISPPLKQVSGAPETKISVNSADVRKSWQTAANAALKTAAQLIRDINLDVISVAVTADVKADGKSDTKVDVKTVSPPTQPTTGSTTDMLTTVVGSSTAANVVRLFGLTAVLSSQLECIREFATVRAKVVGRSVFTGRVMYVRHALSFATSDPPCLCCIDRKLDPNNSYATVQATSGEFYSIAFTSVSDSLQNAATFIIPVDDVEPIPVADLPTLIVESVAGFFSRSPPSMSTTPVPATASAAQSFGERLNLQLRRRLMSIVYYLFRSPRLWAEQFNAHASLLSVLGPLSLVEGCRDVLKQTDNIIDAVGLRTAMNHITLLEGSSADLLLRPTPPPAATVVTLEPLSGPISSTPYTGTMTTAGNHSNDTVAKSLVKSSVSSWGSARANVMVRRYGRDDRPVSSLTHAFRRLF